MSGSRSNTEAQEKRTLGTGGLEKARKGMAGRQRKMMDAEAEAMGGPSRKKTKPAPATEEESE